MSSKCKAIFCFRYKLVVAEALVEHINPIRLKIDDYLKNPEYLTSILDEGGDRAREIAEKTIDEVKLKVGLGQFNGLASMNVLKHRI
jgi:tryptophanyl-tRNA synthetase